MDPTRYAPAYGLSSVIWDSTAADTVSGQTPDSMKAKPDSSAFMLPDSAATILESATDGSETILKETPSSVPESGTTGATDAGTAGSTSTSSADPAAIAAATGTASSTGEPFFQPGKDLGKKDDFGEDFEDKEPLPYRPTITYNVEFPLEVSAELDTATNYIVINKRLSGNDMPGAGALSKDVYLERSIQRADKESWRQAVINKIPTQKTEEGSGIDISIPIPVTPMIDRIIGGSNIGLKVSGNIEVSGDLRVEKKDEEIEGIS